MGILLVPLFTLQEDVQMPFIFRKKKKNNNKDNTNQTNNNKTTNKQINENITKTHSLQQLKGILSFQSGQLSEVEDDLLPTVNKSYVITFKSPPFLKTVI